MLCVLGDRLSYLIYVTWPVCCCNQSFGSCADTWPDCLTNTGFVFRTRKPELSVPGLISVLTYGGILYSSLLQYVVAKFHPRFNHCDNVRFWRRTSGRHANADSAISGSETHEYWKPVSERLPEYHTQDHFPSLPVRTDQQLQSGSLTLVIFCRAPQITLTQPVIF